MNQPSKQQLTATQIAALRWLLANEPAGRYKWRGSGIAAITMRSLGTLGLVEVPRFDWRLTPTGRAAIDGVREGGD